MTDPGQSWRTCLWFYGVIFFESIILITPVDPFFVIQVLKHPTRVWRIALLGTLFSALGGLATYAAGLWCYTHFSAFLTKLCGGETAFLSVQDVMRNWGLWAIAFKSFLPIPYKMMALVSGIAQLPVFPFIVASILGRGLRFFSVCFLAHRYHTKANAIIAQHLSWIQRIGYASILFAILLAVASYFW